MRISLATKIFLGFTALLGSFALLAFFSVGEIRAVADDLRSIKDGHLAISRLAGQLETHQQNRLRDLRRGIDETDPRSKDIILSIATGYFPEVIRSTLADIRAVATRQIEALRGSTARDLKEPFYRGIIERLDRLAERHEGVDELTRRVVAMARSGQGNPAEAARQLDQLEIALRAETYQLNKFIGDETDRAVRRAEQDERNAIWRVVATTGIALFIGLLLTALAARALAPIRRLVHYARAISRGDYEQTVEVGGDNELAILGDELRQMARSRKEREEELDRQADALELAYKRVEELKRYHESIVRSLRTALVVTDRDLTVTSTNRAAETHWGLFPSEVRGQPLARLAVWAPLAERVGALSNWVERAETTHAEAVPIGELLADVTVAPLQNERGDVLGLVLALEDVTDAVRTKEALIRSERLAAIGRMSAHVTHEIRNPLSSIGLNAELLEDLVLKLGGAGDEAEVLCRAIVREVDRLSAITDEYLKFARLPRPELREASVAELIRTIGAFVRRDCQAAGVELVLELPHELPPVHVDPDQMRQALLNLVRNAKESMPQGGRLVLGAELTEGGIVLRVSDSGVGIPAEAVDRIFDPFYSTKLTGTGLGLALTQQIVAEHGGSLEVRSVEGRGSEFRILMPNVEPHEIRGVSGGEGGSVLVAS